MDSVVIPVRSRRQAMDWSLVLVSQGIESGIERPGEDHGWQLVLSAADHARALRAIEQYRAENRARDWLRVGWSGTVFDARCVVWLLVLVGLYLINDAQGGALRTAGMMDSKAVQNGEWWRLFTAVTLHSDWAHLATNVTVGLIFLGLAMGSFGSGLGILAAYLAGVGGNLAGWLVYPLTHRGLGASGMVLGALGLLAADSLKVGQARRLPYFIWRGMFAGVLLLVLFGFNPEERTDIVAHVGGFIAGVVFGVIMGMLKRGQQTTDRAAEVLCGLIVIVSWWMALRG